MKNKQLYLIDGSAYIFRAYHAMPALTRKSDGLPIGAVAGFCNMLYKFLCDINSLKILSKPTHLAIIFDHSSSSFRKELYPQYKANRPTPPDDLIIQFKLIRHAVEAFNLCMIEKPGVEADDIIATYALQAAAEGAEVTIISSDKDLMQLVGENISIYDAVKNKIIAYEQVLEKWQVTPAQMVDFQAIVGDSSDNIPGVKGIGNVGAASLLKEYGSLDNIYANIDKIAKKSIKEKLLAAKENAYLSQKLARLQTNIDLGIKWQDFVLSSWCDADLLGFLKFIGLNKLLVRIASSNNIDVKDIEAKELPINWGGVKEQFVEEKIIIEQNYKQITQLAEILPLVKETGLFGFYQKDEFLYINVDRGNNYFIELSLINNSILEEIFLDKAILKISYNIKEQLHKFSLDMVAYHDIMLMAYVLDNETKLDFADILQKYSPSSTDTPNILLLYEKLRLALMGSKLFYVYELLERPMVRILYNMERKGITIDTKLLEDSSYDLAKEIAILEEDIYDMADEKFNIGSPKQISYILFEKLKLSKGKKTKTGQYSTNVLILEELAKDGAEIAQKMLRWRQLTKLKNTYTDSLPKYADENSRVHTTYLLAATNTARLVSTEPNLQNIPARSSEGRKIREAFIAQGRKLLLCADYNQIELRLLTHIADVKSLQQAFSNNIDIHAQTAAKIFNINLAEVGPELRRRAKAINFGIIYGISAFGLSQQLQISSAEAQEHINLYFSQFPEIKLYMQNTKEYVNKYGFVETIFGRKIYFSKLAKANGALKANLERAAINACIQASAADTIRLAMYNIEKTIAEQNIDLKMLMQVHDELVFEVGEDHVEQAQEFIKQNMENIKLPNGELKTKLRVEFGCAKNLAQAH